MRGEPFSFSAFEVTAGVLSVLVGFIFGALVVGSSRALLVLALCPVVLLFCPVVPWFWLVVSWDWLVVVLLLSSLVLAVDVLIWFVTPVESGWSWFTLMLSSLGVVLSDWPLIKLIKEEGCSVGSPLFEEPPSAELFLGLAPLEEEVEFRVSSSVVVLFPPAAGCLPVVVLLSLPVSLPLDLGCKLLSSSHPPPLMMPGRWTILISC